MSRIFLSRQAAGITRKMGPILVVHGGAGKINPEEAPARRQAVKDAANYGFQVMMRNGSALDGVEAAVVSMEDNPLLNAGVGSCLTIAETVEMDAGVMDGTDLRAGAVGCVSTIKNPVKLARAVMEKSDHVLLVAKGAENFAESLQTIEQKENSYFVTERARRNLNRVVTFQRLIKKEFATDRESNDAPPAKPDDRHQAGRSSLSSPTALDNNETSTTNTTGRSATHRTTDGETDDDISDTVGAVAIDASGNVAVAISTGGLTAKLPGRVGDSPLVGCGMYADNRMGAYCATGNGEAITRSVLCYAVHSRMIQGLDVQQACDDALKEMGERLGNRAGLIAIDAKHGEIGVSFSTTSMSWAIRAENSIRSGTYRGEDFSENVVAAGSLKKSSAAGAHQ